MTRSIQPATGRNAHNWAELFYELARARDVADRFQKLCAALGPLGIDQINYGFFDPAAADRAQAEVLFLSTMKPDWMDYYYAQSLHLTDPHVAFVRQGNLLPYIWGDQAIETLSAHEQKHAAYEFREAGIESALCVPLAGPFDPTRPIAGITLGSTLSEKELMNAVGGGGAWLVTLVHLFHNLSIGSVLREKANAQILSAREKECIQLLASGLRSEAIADRLGIATVTSNLHLHTARKKLKARTLAETVAKALLYGEISL